MLKTLKWAYDLGVKHERVRIARELEAEHGRRIVQSMQYDIVYKDKTESAAKRKDRILYRQSVTEEIRAIVENILEPHNELSRTVSIMFPEPKEQK